jgi:serine/threonine protein phosphatase PrpC
MVCDSSFLGVHGCLNICAGNLALSRALGDFQFKKNYNLIPEQQMITANPDVTVHDIGPEDEFLVLACDGAFGPLGQL